jgi:galactofuranose transport system permease protein
MKRVTSLLQKQGALVGLLALVLFASLRYEAFATPENVINVLRQNSMGGLLAIGMTFVILSGGVDLSVGALAAVGGALAAELSPHGSLVAIVVALLATTLLGAVNGLVVTRARVQPFITTLAMMFAARGLILAHTHEQSVKVDRGASALIWLGRGWIGPLPVPIIILFLGFGIAWVVLEHTRFGRHVFAVGDSDDAARLMGLDIDRVRLGVYVVSGALAGFAGVMLAARVGAGQPVAGGGWELNAITAVVVGGTLLSGGHGNVLSTLVGVLLLGFILNVFNLEGTISSYWQWVLRGVFLLVVVVIQNRLGAKVAAGGESHA